MLVSAKYKPYRGDAFDFWYLRGHHSAYANLRRYHKSLSHRAFRHAERQFLRECLTDPEDVVFEPYSLPYIY